MVLVNPIITLQGLGNLSAGDLLPSLDTSAETERVGRKGQREPQLGMYRYGQGQQLPYNRVAAGSGIIKILTLEQDLLTLPQRLIRLNQKQ